MRTSNCPRSTFLATSGTTTASTHPLGIIGGAVKLRTGLEWFVLPGHGGGPRLREQSGYSRLIQRPECARGFHCLIEPFHALASGDHHGNRQIQRVVQALDGGDRSALEDVSVPHRFHAEHGDSLLDEFGQYLLRKAAEVSVHQIQRHRSEEHTSELQSPCNLV